VEREVLILRSKLMKQAESIAGYFHAKAVKGLILAAVLAVLGACGGIVEDGPEIEEPTIGYNKGDKVKVAVSVPIEEGKSAVSRSMDEGSTQRSVEYYEAIFRKINEDNSITYYRGIAKAGRIIVEIPVGTDYSLLVLAGTGNRTLLAGGYDEDVDIEAGKANTIPITMIKFPLQWNTLAAGNGGLFAIPKGSEAPFSAFIVLDPPTSDFTFDVNLRKFLLEPTSQPLEINADDRFIHVAKEQGGLGAEDIEPGDTFTVTVNLQKLWPLFEADNASIGKTEDADKVLTLDAKAEYVNLWSPIPTNVDNESEPDWTPHVTFERIWRTDGKEPSPSTVETDPPSLEKPTISFTTNSPLPTEDGEKLLEFGLKYRAFGTTDEPFITWNIRNGDDTKSADNKAEVDSQGLTGRGTTNGSEFVVKFGKVIPPDTKVEAQEP
jgi:hypothetical protein